MGTLRLVTDATQILELAGGASGVFDSSGRLLLGNSEMNQMFRYIPGPKEEFHADLLELASANFGKILLWDELVESISPSGFSMSITTPTIPGRIFKCNLGRLEEDRIMMVLTDITPMANLEKQLAMRASVLDKVISDFPSMIAAMDNQGVIRIWNDKCEEITGYTADDMISKPGAFSVLFDNTRSLAEALEKWNSREDDVIKAWRMPIVTKDGSRRIISWTIRYREQPIIEGLHTWAVGNDITKEVVAEEALKESEERFQIICNATNDAIWDWDFVNNVLWWGDGITKLFGHDSRDIENNIEWWVANLHPAERDEVYARINAAVERGDEFWTDEYLFRKKDGTYAYVLDRGYLMRDAKGKPVRMIGGMIDQSAQVLLKRLSDEHNKTIQKEIQHLADRYRAPLNRIVHLSSLLSRMTGENKEIKEIADQLLLSSHQLSSTLKGEMDDDD